MQSDSPSYLKGAVFGLAAASIWAGWSAMTRLAVSTSLDAWDIPALRFGVAGLLLSPILIRRGLARDRLGWLGLAGIITGQGAPYVVVAALGLRFAPAADLGALSPGCMPLFVVLIAATIVGEKPSTTQKFGLSLIPIGALMIIGWRGSTWNVSRTFGDAAFLIAAFLTACFTVIMRQAKLDPIHAAALVSTGSLVIYAPIYLALRGTRLVQLPLADVAPQIFFQGVVVSIVSLVRMAVQW
jgi:drug/metabolite transporter (DMT)-like permease